MTTELREVPRGLQEVCGWSPTYLPRSKTSSHKVLCILAGGCGRFLLSPSAEGSCEQSIPRAAGSTRILLRPPANGAVDGISSILPICYACRRFCASGLRPPARRPRTSRGNSSAPVEAACVSAIRAALQSADDRDPGSGKRNQPASRANWPLRLRGSGCRTAELRPPISGAIGAVWDRGLVRSGAL